MRPAAAARVTALSKVRACMFAFCTALAARGRGVSDNKHSIDVESTNRVHRSLSMSIHPAGES